MHHILSYLAPLILLSTATLIPPPPLPLSNSTPLTIPAPINIPPTTPLDPRFTLTASFSGPPLPPIAALMVTVKALETLGMQDFGGDMEQRAMSFANWAHVGVVVSPAVEGGRIDTRFVVWGLSCGVVHMIHLERFQKVRFALFWEGRGAGTIDLIELPITQSTTQTNHTNSTQSLAQQPNVSLVQNASSLPASIEDTTTTPENAHMKVRVLLTGSSVQVFDVFLLAIAVLVDVAPLAATGFLQTYKSPPTPANIEIIFQEPIPARTSAPFLEVHWLMSAMAVIPVYMIKKGRFHEAYALVDVDGVRVADGFLGLKEDGGGMANVKANISVS